MATVYKGHAFVQGVGPGGCTVEVGTYASCFLDSVPVSHRSNMAEHIGADGDICAMVFNNEFLEMSLTLRPASDTSQAAVKAKMIFLPKGSNVLLDGFQVVNYGAFTDILNSTWILIGDATLTLNADNPASVDITVRHYLSKQTLMQTTVS